MTTLRTTLTTAPQTTFVEETPDDPRSLWPVAICLIVTLIVMGPICGHDFVWWDDQGTIHQNPWLIHASWRSIRHYWLAPQFGIYFPVTACIWVAIASIAHVQQDNLGIALNPWFFHRASVLAHLIAVLLVFRIFRLLNATPWAACCGALVFAIHPVQVESVAWASGLKDVLAGMFSFAAIVQYIHFALAREQGDPWLKRYAWAIVFFVLAMLSKGSAIALPVVVLAIDLWAVGRKWRDAFIAIVPWILVAIPIGIVTVVVQDAVNTPVQPLWIRPLIAADSISFYLYKLLLPIHLGLDYGRTPAVVIAHGWLWWDWIAPVVIGIFLWINRRRWPVLLAAGAVFVGACLTTLGLTVTLYQYFTTVTDHYLYTAMLGPALAVAWFFSLHRGKIIGFAIIAVWSGIAMHQITYWQNDYVLFGHAIDVNPNSYISYGNLGSNYARDNDPKTAAVIFRRAIDINPEYALSFSNLGHALFEAGDMDGALAAEEQSVSLQLKYPALRPAWARDNEQVGDLLIKKKQYAKAEQHFLYALQEKPNDADLIDKQKTAHQLATLPATTTATKGEIPR